MDVLGEVLHWGGQLVVSYVLVGLAYGWTLSSKAVQQYIPDDKVQMMSTVYTGMIEGGVGRSTEGQHCHVVMITYVI